MPENIGIQVPDQRRRAMKLYLILDQTLAVRNSSHLLAARTPGRSINH